MDRTAARRQRGDRLPLRRLLRGCRQAGRGHAGGGQHPSQITWRVEEGPDSWTGTLITFTLRPHGDDGTTLLFTHAGWHEASEFMSGCSTNWGAYLTSLKTGAESGQFAAYPRGEISRWS